MLPFAKLTAICISLLFLGCASTRWVWSGGNPQSFNRDTYQCKLESESARTGVYLRESGLARAFGAGSVAGLYGDLQADDKVKELFEGCMQARWWQKVRAR